MNGLSCTQQHRLMVNAQSPKQTISFNVVEFWDICVPSKPLTLDRIEAFDLFFGRACYNWNASYRKMKVIKVVEKLTIYKFGSAHSWYMIHQKNLQNLQKKKRSKVSLGAKVIGFDGTLRCTVTWVIRSEQCFPDLYRILSSTNGHIASSIPPCFLYSAIYSVSDSKNPSAQCFFWLRSLGSYGIFLGQQLISFVLENYCNCASCGKFCANEFFKHAYKISKSRPHKRIFDARKWTLRGQFTQCQFTRWLL
jgi:hypothetical protein